MLATTLADEGAGDPSGELQELLGDRTDRILNYIAAVVIIAILALMIFKP